MPVAFLAARDTPARANGATVFAAFHTGVVVSESVVTAAVSVV